MPLPGDTPRNAPAPRAVASPAEAELLIKHMIDVMDALLGTVEEETELVRAGRLREAAKLEASKNELSQLYLTDTARIKASHGYLAKAAPDALADVIKRHDEFQAVLQMNLTVLATAHAVSESIMRGVSSELARKATPQGYGASGHAAAPPASSMQPLTLSRVL
jgi:hypothetical protein